MAMTPDVFAGGRCDRRPRLRVRRGAPGRHRRPGSARGADRRGTGRDPAGGVARLVADATTDRLLGAHLVAPNAGDVIGGAVLAIRLGVRVQERVSMLHPYLTWAEGLKLAGHTFTTDVAKLSCCA